MPTFRKGIIPEFRLLTILEIIFVNISENHILRISGSYNWQHDWKHCCNFLKTSAGIFYLVVRRPMLYIYIYTYMYIRIYEYLLIYWVQGSPRLPGNWCLHHRICAGPAPDTWSWTTISWIFHLLGPKTLDTKIVYTSGNIYDFGVEKCSKIHLTYVPI